MTGVPKGNCSREKVGENMRQRATTALENLRGRSFKELGQPSMVAYLEHAAGYAPRTAYDRLRVARALGDLPALENALSTGALSFCAVRELTRVVAPETEKQWLEAVAGKPMRDIDPMVSGRKPGDLPDSPRDPELERYRVVLELSPSAYALLRHARQLLKSAADRSTTPS